jgi:hypothetical protein
LLVVAAVLELYVQIDYLAHKFARENTCLCVATTESITRLFPTSASCMKSIVFIKTVSDVLNIEVD